MHENWHERGKVMNDKELDEELMGRMEQRIGRWE